MDSGRDEDDTLLDMVTLREALRPDMEEQLHLAAAVFRNEMLGDVGKESKALEEENSRTGMSVQVLSKRLTSIFSLLLLLG
jgi:hypothetical protein